MGKYTKRVVLGIAACFLVLTSAVASGSALLWISARWGQTTILTVSNATTTLPTATNVYATATIAKRPTPTLTPTRTPVIPISQPTLTPTPTPQPATQLVFDCATATVIDRVQKSYSVNLCMHTNPPRPYYYANMVLSWCGQPPSSATVTSTTRLDYAGKQTVQGITVIVSCDPPLTIVVTARSLTTDAAPGATYPLQGAATISIPS